MALWERDRQGHRVAPGQLIHHSDAGSQHTSIRLTDHLALEQIDPSIGTVGDAYDNALHQDSDSSPEAVELGYVAPDSVTAGSRIEWISGTGPVEAIDALKQQMVPRWLGGRATPARRPSSRQESSDGAPYRLRSSTS